MDSIPIYQPWGQQTPGFMPPMQSQPEQAQAPQANPNLGYDPSEFMSWYQSQYQADPSPQLIQRLSSLVGAPAGPNGQFSQQQWQQAQQQAQQDTPGFFPEFQAPTFQQGPAYSRGGEFEQGPSFDPGNPYASAPMYQTPEAFSYAGFKAPTAAEAEADEGYQFGLQQGTKAIMGNKAAAGLARTGGTLQNIMDYGRQAATQQYGDVYNRAAQGYQMNRANAADNYATNYQIGRDAWRDRETAQQGAYDRNQAAQQGAWDRNFAARESTFDRNQAARLSEWDRNQAAREGAFDRNYKGASDAYNARYAGRQQTFEDMYRRWQTKVVTELQRELGNK